MSTSITAKRLALGLALIAAAGSSVFGGSANADPKQYDGPFVGVGSDTTQDVMNAMAGFSNGINYTPIQSTSASGFKQITSWDATLAGSTTTCISTRTGGPSFNRPFGSGAGRAALLSTLTGGSTSVSNCGVGTTSVSGQLSFARSSSISGTAGTTMAYVPFARDALSYGAVRAAGSPITDLTLAELGQIFTTPAGVDITRGAVTVRVLGCSIQASSGTGTTWLTKISATAQVLGCDNLINPATSAAFGASAENDGQGLVARATAADLATPGAQVVIGFSVGNYIGTANLVAPGGMPATVVIGSIPDVAGGVAPLSGTVPNLVGNTTYYNSSFGRDLYNVFPASIINSAFGNDAIKSLFKGATSAICQQTVTIQKFGFLPVATCGDSTTTVRGG